MADDLAMLNEPVRLLSQENDRIKRALPNARSSSNSPASAGSPAESEWLTAAHPCARTIEAGGGDS